MNLRKAMTNKLEISRELAERLIRAIDESQPSPLYAELRALLAAEPVDANAHLPYRVESLSEFLSRDATPVVERQDPVARIAHDDEDAQAAFEALNPMPRHVTKFKGGYAATEFNAWDAHEFCKKWDGFNQCAKLYAEQSEPVAVVMSFDFEHPLSKERRTVTLTKQDVYDGMEDYFYDKLGEQICQCESVGETNVVDCNCDEYVHDFELVADKVKELNP